MNTPMWPDAMQRLVERHQRSLHRFFLKRSRNRWDAEELTQEVFCKILNNDAVAIADYTESYLFTIAWNVLLDRARKEKVRRRESHVPFEEALAPDRADSVEQEVIGDEFYARFVRALKRLTPRSRQVFVLSRYEGLSYQEIADYCGLSLSSVEKHITQSMRRLKELLKE